MRLPCLAYKNLRSVIRNRHSVIRNGHSKARNAHSVSQNGDLATETEQIHNEQKTISIVLKLLLSAKWTLVLDFAVICHV